MRLRRPDLQRLQSLRSEMRSGLYSLRSEMRSCRSGLWLRRPGLQHLQSLRPEMRPGSRLPSSANMLRIPSFRRSVR